MSIYRKRKNSMKQADKETVKKSLVFQIEEEKDNETIFQTGKVWCEDCMDWIEQVEKKDEYLCCEACGNGVVKLT